MLASEAPTAASGTDGSDQPPGDPGSELWAHWTYRAGLALFGLQFVGLIVLAAFTYRRFTLGIDFAIFNQAWSQIGSGHLNPYSTIHGVPFIKNHFEIIMWPLALLHPVVHSAFALLVVQVAALVTTEIVAFTWVTALVRKSNLSPTWLVAVSAGTMALLLVDPGSYSSVVEDFHFEAVATCFVVLAAYDLWSRRTRRMWVWVVLCLLCGDIGGLYLFGMGLSALVVRERRRPGALVLLTGLVWVGLISALGANSGSNLSTGYAYLAGRTSLPGGLAGLGLVAEGTVLHPGRAMHADAPRIGTAVRYVLNGGGVGALTPWGFGVPLVVLGTSVLQYDGIFIGLPFQNFVVLPFVVFGSAWAVVWLATRARSRNALRVAAVVGAIALLIGVATSAQRLQADVTFNASSGFVPAADAAALGLALAKTPGDAEVVAPVPTMGRFAQRAHVYLLVAPPGLGHSSVPIRARTVVVVVDPSIDPAVLPPKVATALVRRLERDGARVLVTSSGVTAVQWHPPPGMTSLRLS